MNLNFFTREALQKLKNDIDINIDKYGEKESWIDSYFTDINNTKYSFFSERVIDNIKLAPGTPENDAENAIILHKALNNKISRINAMDERMWAYLAHNEFYEYVYERWIENKSISVNMIKERFFFSKGKRNRRNGLARLYWGAEITYDDRLENPYYYTEFLFKKQDRYQTVTDYDFTRNKEVLLPVLKAMDKIERSGEGLTEGKERNLFTKINRHGGLLVLDSLDEKDMEKVVLSLF